MKNKFILATELFTSIGSDSFMESREGEARGKRWSYLITDQNVNASWTLFEDLANLPGRDVEELSQLLCQLSSCELL